VIVMMILLGWPSSIYLTQQVRGRPLSAAQLSLMIVCFSSAAALSLAIWSGSMRSGVRALMRMGD
jgi:hypothetical protein